MSRASVQPDKSTVLDRWQRRALRWAAVPAVTRHGALIHLGVIAASLVALSLSEQRAGGEVFVWLAILCGFALLRTISAGRELASSAYLLEPVGVAMFLAATGGAASAFLAVAPAGIWWATVGPESADRGAASVPVPRRWHQRILDVAAPHSMPGRLAAYGGLLVATYVLLVLPGAVRQQAASIAIENAVLLTALSLMAIGWARTRESLRRGQFWIPALGEEELAIREGLERALRTIDIPIDAVLAAGRIGLTAQQAELLAYVLLGLSNQEIADATQVSEATIRYRLTRLYRTLGVTGRKQATARARELGLTTTPRFGPGIRPHIGPDRT